MGLTGYMVFMLIIAIAIVIVTNVWWIKYNKKRKDDEMRRQAQYNAEATRKNR